MKDEIKDLEKEIELLKKMYKLLCKKTLGFILVEEDLKDLTEEEKEYKINKENKTEKNLIKCLIWFMDSQNTNRLQKELDKRGHKKELELLNKNIEDNFYECFKVNPKEVN